MDELSRLEVRGPITGVPEVIKIDGGQLILTETGYVLKTEKGDEICFAGSTYTATPIPEELESVEWAKRQLNLNRIKTDKDPIKDGDLVVASTAFPIEINKQTIRAHLEATRYYRDQPLLNGSFINWDLEFLLECFGGKKELVDFVTDLNEEGKKPIFYDKLYGPFEASDRGYCTLEEFIEKYSKDIDEVLAKKEHTPAEVGGVISPCLSEMDEVVAETAREVTTPELSPEAKRPEDNGSNPGGDNRG